MNDLTDLISGWVTLDLCLTELAVEFVLDGCMTAVGRDEEDESVLVDGYESNTTTSNTEAFFEEVVHEPLSFDGYGFATCSHWLRCLDNDVEMAGSIAFSI